MKTEKELSEFAMALRSLLDETGVYTRSEWAEILNVTESAISQWVNDDTLPRAETLRRIVGTLDEDTRVADSVLEAFEVVARKPLSKISPHGPKTAPTLEHYMARPSRAAFDRVLESLPPHLQEEVLYEAAALARQRRARGTARPTVAERRQRFRDVRPRTTREPPHGRDSTHAVVLPETMVSAGPASLLPAPPVPRDQRFEDALRVIKQLVNSIELDPASSQMAHEVPTTDTRHQRRWPLVVLNHGPSPSARTAALANPWGSPHRATFKTIDETLLGGETAKR